MKGIVPTRTFSSLINVEGGWRSAGLRRGSKQAAGFSNSEASGTGVEEEENRRVMTYKFKYHAKVVLFWEFNVKVGFAVSCCVFAD